MSHSLKLVMALGTVVVAVAVWFLVWNRSPEPGQDTGTPIQENSVTGSPETVPPEQEVADPERAEVTTPPPEDVEANETSAETGPATRVHGIVRTPAGLPAVGAWVILAEEICYDLRGENSFYFVFLVDAAGGLPEEGEGFRTTRTDEAGRYEFLDATPADNAVLAAYDPVEGTVHEPGITIPTPPAAVEHPLQLEAGVVLHGVVFGPDGQPLPEVQIMASGRRTEQDTWTWVAQSGRVTDEHGAFRLPPVPYQQWRLMANKRGFEEGGTDLIEVLAGEREHRVEIHLEEEVVRVLTGRLLTSGGGPAALWESLVDFVSSEERVTDLARSLRAHVSVEDPRTHGPVFMNQTGEGSVDVEEDRYRIEPFRDGGRFVSIWWDNSLLGVAPMADVATGPDVVIDWSSVDVATLRQQAGRGTLVITAWNAESSEAIPAFEVQVNEDPTGSYMARLKNASDPATGTARAEDVTLGVRRVTLRAEGFAPEYQLVTLDRDGQELPVEFRLTKGDGQAQGTVQRQDGTPVNGAEVYLYRTDGTPALPSPEFKARCNAEGRFHYESIVSGEYRLVASAPMEVPLAPTSISVHIQATTAPVLMILEDGVTVAVEPDYSAIPQAMRVTRNAALRIRDASGAPVVDHMRPGLAILAGWGGSRNVRLSPGAYTVEFHCSDRQWLPRWSRVGRARFTAAEGAHVLVPIPGD